MNNENKRERSSRVVDHKCPNCGHKKMWECRSSTGRGLYIYKCTKCGYMVK